MFGLILQYPALRRADMFHVTSEKEYGEIRALGYGQPIAIVPIGMDMPDVVASGRTWGVAGKKKIVFFGRIHAVKNVDWLVRAWEILSRKDFAEGWEILIAGPDGGVMGALKVYLADHHIQHVTFVGEINGAAKYEFLSQADLYVLPSQTENFGVTLAEALACGTPSLGSRGTPWQDVAKIGCGSWGFSNPEELACELGRLMQLSDDDRRVMGERGKQLIRDHYSWAGVGMKMKIAYEWLLHGGERPEYVKI